MVKFPALKKYEGLLITAGLAALVFFPIVYQAVYSTDIADHQAHIRFAERIWREKHLMIPHFLYQLEILFFEGIFSLFGVANYKAAGFLASIFNFVFLGMALFLYVRSRLRGAVRRLDFASSCLALSLALTAPISLLFWTDHLQYLGYLSSTVYHSPTTVLAKLLALLLFWCSTENIFKRQESSPTAGILWLAVLTALSALAKPSYLIAFLPGLVLFCIFTWKNKRSPDIRSLVFGVLIPGLLVLAWQYFAYYPENNITIVFAPFAALKLYSNYLFLKFLLSAAFPLFVYVFYFPAARKSLPLNLAWMAFCFGAAFAYLLGEKERMSHGNFTWSGGLTLFLVFLESTLCFVRSRPSRENSGPAKRSKLIWIIGCFLFSAHLLSGIFYYLYIYFMSPRGQFLYV